MREGTLWSYRHFSAVTLDCINPRDPLKTLENFAQYPGWYSFMMGTYMTGAEHVLIYENLADNLAAFLEVTPEVVRGFKPLNVSAVRRDIDVPQALFDHLVKAEPAFQQYYDPSDVPKGVRIV